MDQHLNFELTFSRLRDPDTLYELRHFLTYLTSKTTVLSRLEVSDMSYDPEAQTFRVEFSGTRDLAYQLYFHSKTFYADYQPKLESITKPLPAKESPSTDD